MSLCDTACLDCLILGGPWLCCLTSPLYWWGAGRVGIGVEQFHRCFSSGAGNWWRNQPFSQFFIHTNLTVHLVVAYISKQ